MKTVKTTLKSTLIIDNQEVKNSYLVNIFLENGLYLQIISEADDYLLVLETKKIDCVMINPDLPNKDIYLMIDQIKALYPEIVVIILLNDQDFEKLLKFVRLGVDDFLQKPFTWWELENLLNHYYY